MTDRPPTCKHGHKLTWFGTDLACCQDDVWSWDHEHLNRVGYEGLKGIVIGFVRQMEKDAKL
ncbi:MAG: hypothetical protein KGL39_05710 [Patescibacteria group bacterium]|nr:hypothetical protein [Patescibacteria group bacterium]